ncbi:PAS domain-containing protein [Pedobacter sp. SYSU D00535]|uniref:sensor histidine kinase n=1 Tax=Pedobacter sp. SYSU D00535 TaxID=2810308 RepID=UPI001A9694DB|nr:PAS domain-containing sensor histidine kinase [Pedobacter sp. SYSU D00535]
MLIEDQKSNLTISENLLKNLQGMFYRLTSPPELTMIYVSQGCLSLTGYSVEELLEINLSDLVHPEDLQLFSSAFYNATEDGGSVQTEYRIMCKDGSVKWVRDVASVSLNESDGVDIEGFITDISNQKKGDSAIKALEKEHKGLLNELTQKYNELMQFNYIVSHNLRSPIANIIGLTEILKFHYAEEASETGELVNFISDSASSIDSIIQDLNLILSSRKPINEKREELDFQDIINSVKNNLKKQIVDSNAIIKNEIPDELRHFKSIKSYVQSIFYNLISNSIKYTEDGVAPVITISAEKVEEGLQIAISDQGIGMDLCSMGDKLFGLYKKFNFDKEGRGLGLHMTRTQIQSLGGKIDVASEPGKGTTFRITLPE